MSQLRRWHPERDAVAVLAAFRASDDLHRQAPALAELADARAYLEAIAAEALAIVDDDEAVGCVMASARDERHGTAWMSSWPAPQACGKGVATRALDTMSRECFADGFHRLELGARAKNPASIAVAQRAGYVREGLEESDCSTSMTRVRPSVSTSCASPGWRPIQHLRPSSCRSNAEPRSP